MAKIFLFQFIQSSIYKVEIKVNYTNNFMFHLITKSNFIFYCELSLLKLLLRLIGSCI